MRKHSLRGQLIRVMYQKLFWVVLQFKDFSCSTKETELMISMGEQPKSGLNRILSIIAPEKNGRLLIFLSFYVVRSLESLTFFIPLSFMDFSGSLFLGLHVLP